jgi:hypothetical protein
MWRAWRSAAPKGELHLAKKSGVWVVAEKADYRDLQRVSGFIRQLWELQLEEKATSERSAKNAFISFANFPSILS